MRSECCLEWQPNVKPSALKEFRLMAWGNLEGRDPCQVSHSLPPPSPGSFVHRELSTRNIPTASPFFSPSALPPVATSSRPSEKHEGQSSRTPLSDPLSFSLKHPPLRRSQLVSPATLPNYG